MVRRRRIERRSTPFIRRHPTTSEIRRVHVGGTDPPTSCVSSRRSATELHVRGGSGRLRPCDTRCFKPVLYQAELRNQGIAGRAHGPAMPAHCRVQLSSRRQVSSPQDLRTREGTSAGGRRRGADDGPRTRSNQFGKLGLVQLSFIRMRGTGAYPAPAPLSVRQFQSVVVRLTTRPAPFEGRGSVLRAMCLSVRRRLHGGAGEGSRTPIRRPLTSPS